MPGSELRVEIVRSQCRVVGVRDKECEEGVGLIGSGRAQVGEREDNECCVDGREKTSLTRSC